MVPPGRASLRYYKTREDFVARREPAGAIDSAKASLEVERSPGSYVLHIVAHDGQRSLALKADAASTLEHWVVALSSPGRATSVSNASMKKSVNSNSNKSLANGGNGGSARTASSNWDGKPVKVLLLGDSGVGKTAVLTRFSDGLFVSSTRATVGIDLKKSTIDLDGDGSPLPLQVSGSSSTYAQLHLSISPPPSLPPFLLRFGTLPARRCSARSSRPTIEAPTACF